MATRNVSQRQLHYGIIQRGASLTIPVTVKTPHDEPIDLTGLRVSFTIKKVREDFDREDVFPYVRKDFDPQEPEDGRFLILLSSADTDFQPGDFWFDIQLTAEDGMVNRLTTLQFELAGGPTNRNVNPGMGQMPVGDEITIMHLSEGPPVVILAPLVAWSPSTYAQIAELKLIIGALVLQVEAQDVQIQDLTERVEALEEGGTTSAPTPDPTPIPDPTP